MQDVNVFVLKEYNIKKNGRNMMTTSYKHYDYNEKREVEWGGSVHIVFTCSLTLKNKGT